MATAVIPGGGQGRRRGSRRWLRDGAFGGLIAGIAFAMFQMIMAALIAGPGAFFNPLRMIAAMVLGVEALTPGYPLPTAAAAGLVVHMMLSVGFGVVVGLALAALPALARTTGTLVATAGLFGILIWLVNFYVIAPAAGWNWFPAGTLPVVQLLAHGAVFGGLLGLYFAWTGTRFAVAATRQGSGR